MFILAAAGVAGASAVVPGNGQVVFKNVPVTPGSFMDFTPIPFAINKKASRPQTFDYGVAADVNHVTDWYRQRLVRMGWHLQQTHVDYPAKGDNVVIADRTGEAVTVVMFARRYGTRVELIKLISAK